MRRVSSVIWSRVFPRHEAAVPMPNVKWRYLGKNPSMSKVFFAGGEDYGGLLPEVDLLSMNVIRKVDEDKNNAANEAVA